jgi:hypothetical protein
MDTDQCRRDNSKEPPSPWQTALVILVCLVSVYTLTYSGTFITDDEHILAVRTISLAFDEEINYSRVLGNSRVYNFSMISPEALNIEPGQAIIGSLLARAAVMLGVGQVQAIFLLNVWTTALTAVVLFCTVLVHGYSQRTATVTAVVFGVGSIAWPYSQTYFRDPLAMFFLACAWLFAQLLIKDQKSHLKGKIYSLFGFVFFSIVGVLTKNTTAIAIPIMFLEILLNKIVRSGNYIKCLAGILAVSKKTTFILTGVVLLLSAWFLIVPRVPQLFRASPEYYLIMLTRVASTPLIEVGDAFIGTLLSPGKSIFLFSPVLVLALVSLFSHWKTAWPAWLYLGLLMFAQGLFYGLEWPGHVNWGARYTLPALPLLVISSAPVIDTCLKDLKKRIGILMLTVFSVSIQLLGIFAPINEYYVEMARGNQLISTVDPVWNPKYSIIVWSGKWLLSGGELEIAAARLGVKFLPIWGMVCLIGFGSYMVFRGRKRKIISFGLGIIGISIAVVLLFICRTDPAFNPKRMDLVNVQQVLEKEYKVEDVVLIQSYGSSAWQYWMNWTDPRVQWIALPFSFPQPFDIDRFLETKNPEEALDEITVALLTQEIQQTSRAWLVAPSDSPGAGLGLEASWLEACAYESREWQFDSGLNETRLYLFNIEK